MSSHDHHMMNTSVMNSSMMTDGHMHGMTTTTMNMHNGMDMGGGNGGHSGGHNHGGVGMDMNGTDDRTCSGEMLMFFHKGNCEYILFETVRTENYKGIIAACFAIAALAIVYEGLKVLREHLLQRSMIQNNKYAVSNGTASQEVVISNKNVGIHMMSCSHFIQTFLHMVQVFISYCLMLVFMTYNVWLCLSVVVGAGIGYFLFGWRKAIVVDINEHCH